MDPMKQGEPNRVRLPSIKENLTPEAWWAIKIHLGALAALMIATIFVGFTFNQGPIFIWIAFFFGFLDSLYWVVYIKRGIDRRFEREEQRNRFEEQTKRGFAAPDARLLQGDPARNGGQATVTPFQAPKSLQ